MRVRSAASIAARPPCSRWLLHRSCSVACVGGAIFISPLAQVRANVGFGQPGVVGEFAAIDARFLVGRDFTAKKRVSKRRFSPDGVIQCDQYTRRSRSSSRSSSTSMRANSVARRRRPRAVRDAGQPSSPQSPPPAAVPAARPLPRTFRGRPPSQAARRLDVVATAVGVQHARAGLAIAPGPSAQRAPARSPTAPCDHRETPTARP